jgi:hypothetical protein
MRAMRPTTRRALLLLPIAMATAACQAKPLTISVSGDANNVTISASERGPFGLFEIPSPISSVRVWPNSGGRYPDWETRSSRCPSTIHEVRYGTSPDGFEEVLTPRPLADGRVYFVMVESCDGNSGGGNFKIENGRVGQILYLVARDQ